MCLYIKKGGNIIFSKKDFVNRMLVIFSFQYIQFDEKELKLAVQWQQSDIQREMDEAKMNFDVRFVTNSLLSYFLLDYQLYTWNIVERKVSALARTRIIDHNLPVVAISVAADCEGRSRTYDGVYNARIEDAIRAAVNHNSLRMQIGRASCRERV